MSALTLVASTVLQSTAFAGLLADGPSARRRAEIALACLLAVTALSMAVSLVPDLAHLGDGQLSAALLVIALPLALLFGPLTFTTVEALVAGEAAPRGAIRRHCGPWFATGLLLAVPLALASHAEDPSFAEAAPAQVWLTALAVLAFVGVGTGYLARGAFRVVGQRHTTHASPQDRKLARRVVVLASAAWVVGLLEELPPILALPALVDPAVTAAVDGLCVFAIGCLALRHRSADQSTLRPSRYMRSVLTEAQASRLERKLRHTMETDRVYRDPDLSLARLAARVGCPPHKLTHLLATRLREPYHDHVNGWRVAEACALLRATDETVLAISLAVGFNTRSTFNAAFAKRTGMSPTAFRAAARGDPAGASRVADPVHRASGSPVTPGS